MITFRFALLNLSIIAHAQANIDYEQYDNTHNADTTNISS